MPAKPGSAVASVDWALLCAFLRKNFGSLARAARAANSQQINADRLSALANGVVIEPPFSRGLALLDFAADHLTAEQWAQVRAGSRIAQ